ncbi:MAG: hypothetical protein ACE14T_06115 [Syntrophales bacterium]
MSEPNDFAELLPAVQAVLVRYRKERRLSELARSIGFSKNRLTEIMYGKRKLTPYYLIKLIEAGAMTVGQLFNGTDIRELSHEKRIMARRLLIDAAVIDILDEEMQLLLKEAVDQKRIEDLKTILKTVLKK